MRQRLLILILSCLGALAPALAQAWWQEDWSYRKQITVDTTQEGAAITERVGRMPVLVRLHTGNFSFDGVKENGADLRFVIGDDETVLNHRIESFDALLGVAYIWVDVPEIQGGARQDIWMYYGNPQAPLPDSNQVFDADYAGVYHFDGAPGGSADDATAYNNDSTNPVSGTTTGVIAQAAQFSGEPLMLPASPSLAVAAGGAFSFSAWIKAPQAAGEQLLYARRQGGNALLIGIANGVPFVEVNGQRSERGQPLAADQWQHLAVTTGAQGVTLYLNGRQAGQMAVALPAFNGVAALGGDVPGYRTGVAGGAEGANDSTGKIPGKATAKVRPTPPWRRRGEVKPRPSRRPPPASPAPWTRCACRGWSGPPPCCAPAPCPRDRSRGCWCSAWTKSNPGLASAPWGSCSPRCRWMPG